MSELESITEPQQHTWQTLDPIDRRVVGVLVEKAKTTPDNYPLTLNALVNGCNQKSNRFPQMQLDEEQVDESLDRLRSMGAVAVVQGDGRVDKYRHLLYDWLGVDKVELAVMAELLLRGAQTLGDLRARAARMEPLSGLSELKPIVEQLREKKMLILLTPPGRGCVVTHALYGEDELAKLRAEHGNRNFDEESLDLQETPVARAPQSPPQDQLAEIEQLRCEVTSLREELAHLRQVVEQLTNQ